MSLLCVAMPSLPVDSRTRLLHQLTDTLAKRRQPSVNGSALKSLMGERTADEVRELLRSAIIAELGDPGDGYIWVRDFSASWVVYEVSGRYSAVGLFAAPYAVGPGDVVTFGTALPVEPETDYRAVSKRGARNSRVDLSRIQAMHDTAVDLGASCPTPSPSPSASAKATKVVKAAAGEVVRKDAAKRYTLMPLYPAAPENPTVRHLDAHGDMATSDDVQSAVWEYVKAGDRIVRDQHRPETAIGEMVEIMCWPFEVTVPLEGPDGAVVEKSFDPYTAFMGVIWTPSGWNDVEKGRKTGLSLGGTALRVDVELSA